ncbi:MAG: RING finger domain-containing protein [Chlamydiales bacterium]|nr:RING finger domain-containing protein [Chlamydiales bacterium]
MNNIRGVFESSANLVSMNIFQDDGEGNNSWIGVGLIALGTITALASTIYYSKAGYFFSMRASDDDMCTVCQDDFSGDRDVVGHSVNNAKHIFHRTCAEPWVNEHRDCPICRMPVASIDPTFLTRMSQNEYLRSVVGAAIYFGVIETVIIGETLMRRSQKELLLLVGILTYVVLPMLGILLGQNNFMDITRGGIATGTFGILSMSMLLASEDFSWRQLTVMELTSIVFLTNVLFIIAATAYRRNH